MTKQSFKDECDINQIMAKYQKTGLINHFQKNQAQYGFAPAVDFRTALELVDKAERQFEELPSSIRKRFDNDPGQFLAFCEDPANRSEMAVLGLLTEEATAAVNSSDLTSDDATASPPATPPPTPE